MILEDFLHEEATARRARRSKGRPVIPAMEPEQVLRAALELIDERGLDGFTMRSLAQRVGVEVASLYNHFANKEAILYATMDLAVTEHMADLAPRGNWKRWMAEGTRAFRAVLIEHPGLMDVMQRRNISQHGSPFQDEAAAQLVHLGAPPALILPLLNIMAFLCVASAMNYQHEAGRTQPGESAVYAEFPRLAALAGESDGGDEETFMTACRALLRVFPAQHPARRSG